MCSQGEGATRSVLFPREEIIHSIKGWKKPERQQLWIQWEGKWTQKSPKWKILITFFTELPVDALSGILDPFFVDMALEYFLIFSLPDHFKALLVSSYQQKQTFTARLETKIPFAEFLHQIQLLTRSTGRGYSTMGLPCSSQEWEAGGPATSAFPRRFYAHTQSHSIIGRNRKEITGI